MLFFILHRSIPSVPFFFPFSYHFLLWFSSVVLFCSFFPRRFVSLFDCMSRICRYLLLSSSILSPLYSTILVNITCMHRSYLFIYSLILLLCHCNFVVSSFFVRFALRKEKTETEIIKQVSDFMFVYFMLIIFNCLLHTILLIVSRI